MRTKLVYVLVSGDSDVYLEQAYASMYSAKYHMPDCFITLLTDGETLSGLTGERGKKLRHADEVVTARLDGGPYTAQQRSRLLKTGARRHVSGDFLFIDCDTLVVRPLYELDGLDCELGACRDTHAPLAANPYRDGCVRDCRSLGFAVDDEEDYFNSGVVYARDTEAARGFYAAWNRNLTDGWKSSVYMDQPSFAKANRELGHPVRRLPDAWNCELKHGIRFLREAKIVHYLCTNRSANKDVQLFVMNDMAVLEGMRRTDLIPEAVRAAIRDPFLGLAPVTHCFAGRDVFFFRTDGFRSLRESFDLQEWPQVERCVGMLLHRGFTRRQLEELTFLLRGMSRGCFALFVPAMRALERLRSLRSALRRMLGRRSS